MHVWRTCLIVAAVGILSSAVWGCDAGGGDPTATGDDTDAAGDSAGPSGSADTDVESESGEGTPDDTTRDSSKADTAVAGRVVSLDGEPIAGVKVLACTPTTCITNTTVSDGTYLSTVAGDEPRKMEVLGGQLGFATMVWYQDVVVGETAWLPRDVHLPVFVDDPQPWLVDEGGEIVVAEGQLELQAQPGALVYPLGTFVEQIRAVELDPALLPPHDVEPWAGTEAKSLAFVFDPFDLHATTPVSFVAHPGADLDEGAIFSVWTADGLHGTMHEVGTATVDAAGAIVADPETGISAFTTLVFVPE